MSVRAIQKDIFPQMMTFDVTESSANTTTSSRIEMPIARMPRQTRVQVIEITNIWLEYSQPLVATGDSVFTSLSFRNFDTTEATLSNASVFFKDAQITSIITSGNVDFQNVKKFDMTTGGGRGFLIATDSLFAQVGGASVTAVQVARYKVWYRFVDIGLQEYIGIVQQQNAQN